jgi:Ca2+/H+ antiporter
LNPQLKQHNRNMPVWTWLVPVLSLISLVAALVAGVGPALAVLCGVALMGTVIASVHHAEVVAHRVGEPFGTLVLAVAVTVIEAALILSIGPGARLDLRCRDDHLQWGCRHLHSGGRNCPP